YTAVWGQVRGTLGAGRFEPADESRAHARRFELAVRPAILIDAQLLEPEDFLHGDHVLFHAEDFGDGRDFARPALKAIGLHDDVDRGADLLPHGFDGQFDATHHDH